MSHYNQKFYSFLGTSSSASARVVVPLVVDLVHPSSVLDVGSGAGEWLKVFAESGIADYQGVDGPWIDAKMLRIPSSHFQSVDLRKPFDLRRRFDLVVSLEVAEHIPMVDADAFVNSLVHHGEVILFSAAVPGQGGTLHVNEQWPDYWAQLFLKHGYTGIDCIRPRVWSSSEVDYWYSQNSILFVSASRLADDGVLKAELTRWGTEIRSLVHPRLFSTYVTLGGALHAAARRLRDRVRRIGR